MPSIDIDRDGAHLAAQTELGKSIYSKASAAEQFTEWVKEQVYRLLQKAATPDEDPRPATGSSAPRPGTSPQKPEKADTPDVVSNLPSASTG